MSSVSEEAVTRSWNRIDTWLQANAPTVFAALKPGASESELQALQPALGVIVPPDVIASYRIHNGTNDGSLSVSLAGWYDFFSLDRIKSEWTIWKELLDAGEFDDDKSEPDQPEIRPDWWNDHWIPFTGDGGGNHLCIDLDPAEGGRVGQIITMWHDDELRSLIAPYFASLLEPWAGALENGEYVMSRYGLVTVAEAATYG